MTDKNPKLEITPQLNAALAMLTSHARAQVEVGQHVVDTNPDSLPTEMLDVLKSQNERLTYAISIVVEAMQELFEPRYLSMAEVQSEYLKLMERTLNNPRK